MLVRSNPTAEYPKRGLAALRHGSFARHSCELRTTMRIVELSCGAAETFGRVVGQPCEADLLESAQLEKAMSDQANHTATFRITARQAPQLEIELSRFRAQISEIGT